MPLHKLGETTNFSDSVNLDNEYVFPIDHTRSDHKGPCFPKGKQTKNTKPIEKKYPKAKNAAFLFIHCKLNLLFLQGFVQ